MTAAEGEQTARQPSPAQRGQTALAAYAEHGRIVGAGREEALDLLRQRYGQG